MGKNNQFRYKSIDKMISAIIVTYNQEQYLYETIESILYQDYPIIELIIADDGTKQFNEDAIRAFIDSKKKSNLVFYLIIHNDTNVGTVRNLNKALSYTHGEYIKIIGGDDKYPIPDVFSLQVDKLNSNVNDLATIGLAQQCDYKMHPISDERVDRSNSDLPIVLSMEYNAARRYIYKRDIFPIAIQAICYKRDFFIQNGFCDENYLLLDDSPSALKILKSASKISFTNIVTVFHRSNVGISTSKEFFSPKRILYYKDCITYCKKEIITHPEIYGYLGSIERLRGNKYIYDMAIAKRDNASYIQKMIITTKYLDAILFLVLKNPKKIWNRVMKRLK